MTDAIRPGWLGNGLMGGGSEMRLSAKSVLVVAVVLITSLLGVNSAAASSARESNRTDLVCKVSGSYVNWSVYWSNTTNHRVSIDKVVLGSAYLTGIYPQPLRANFVSPTQVQVYQGSDYYHISTVPSGYNSPSAQFYWPQQWRTAPSTNPVHVWIYAKYPDVCKMDAKFWG